MNKKAYSTIEFKVHLQRVDGCKVEINLSTIEFECMLKHADRCING